MKFTSNSNELLKQIQSISGILNSNNALPDTQVTPLDEANSNNALANDKSDSENSEKDPINIKKKEKDSIKEISQVFI